MRTRHDRHHPSRRNRHHLPKVLHRVDAVLGAAVGAAAAAVLRPFTVDFTGMSFGDSRNETFM